MMMTSVVGCASCLNFYGGKMSNFSFLFHHYFVLFSRVYATKSSISAVEGGSSMLI
jgi:hypothetical protein